MPLLETKGAASAQGFGEFAKVGAANYIEDVFSTWLYTGTGSAQTITNGIDLSTYGGLVFGKCRSTGGSTYVPTWVSNATGLGSFLNSSSTAGLGGLTASTFNTNGFTINTANSRWNESGQTYASWTFRKQPKFFDVVTYTGNGANRTIAHSLGSVPGCIIVKRTDTDGDWQAYHRSLANTEYLVLNSTAAKATGTTRWNSTTPTSTVFSLGTDATVNANGGSYVAYLFAHDAGGFGLTGTDNVISCGSATCDSGGTATVNLGYEPQWVLFKSSSAASDWRMLDNMRGWTNNSAGNQPGLLANSSAAETTYGWTDTLSPTGFTIWGSSSQQFIYIAIRRGPMKTPTSGTSVFTPTVYTGTNVDNRLVDTTIAPDMVWVRQRNDTVLGGMVVGDRLRAQPYLLTGSTAAEVDDADAFDKQLVSTTEYGTAFSSMTGFWCGNDATAKLNTNTTSNNHIAEAFKRAPGFFDVVCYTGTGSATTQAHNLGVVPELIIVKRRSGVDEWAVGFGFTASDYDRLRLETTAASSNNESYFGGFPYFSAAPTSTTMGIGSNASTNESGATYVAYLFASCPGVSKVGSYTGTGTTLQIDCGFTGGARFVLIKRTDSTGDWYCWDSSRGIVSGNDSYLVLNSTAAEVTNTDWVDTYSAGFELSNAAGNNVNINGASYIFLSVA